jgi:putative membrane protein
MQVLATLSVGLLALLHLYILVLEMFFWTTPRGRAAFGLTPEFAEATKTLAANQGLYNGFLAAGLAWGAWSGAEGGSDGFALRVFFLACVMIAGVFGAVTSSRKILFVQTLPSALALALVLLANR